MIALEPPDTRRPKPIFIADQVIERFVLPVEERANFANICWLDANGSNGMTEKKVVGEKKSVRNRFGYFVLPWGEEGFLVQDRDAISIDNDSSSNCHPCLTHRR